MPAPIKPSSQQTGNFKPLAVFVAVLSIAITLIVAANLPAVPNTLKPPAEPEVAGVSTTLEPTPQSTTSTTPPQQNTPSPSDQLLVGPYEVTAVVDGDTIKIANGTSTDTLRLIGVDTPETKDPRKSVQCFGQQASDFTKTSLLGKKVLLESDESQQNLDKYGRLLRYVYLSDGTLFNKQLIEQGYAYEYTYNVPYKYSEQFKGAQTLAQANKQGLWQASTCNGQR